MAKCNLSVLCYLCLILLLVYSVGLVSAQEVNQSACYGPGSIAASVILSIIFTALLVVALYFLWKKYNAKRAEHLILENDVEKGKDEYAFDNPGFKDNTAPPVTKSFEKNALEHNKPKWNQWTPLTALITKSSKRKTLDDSAIDGNEVKVVALRSHDFTGLGFNICGNMKEGIYIKDILHRGPASESGKLNPGDRINSVTISFEHMVYEDALTILSYASPYEVIIEARGGKIMHHGQGQGAQPTHPVYRSSSYTNLLQGDKAAKKKLFGGEDLDLSSSYSSLQKTKSNTTTLERQESKSPKMNQANSKKIPPKLTPDQLKNQLEKKILPDHQQNMKNKLDKPRIEVAETQKTENNKYQKFGIRVLPLDESPKTLVMSQNENNINIEKNKSNQVAGIDEVDEIKPPQAKKRENKNTSASATPKSEEFTRSGSINGSGIRRDKNGIPQEIPAYMMNAATAARSNRKSSVDRSINRDDETGETKSQKKLKGKAPAPPDENCKTPNNLDEIQYLNDEAQDAKTQNSPVDQKIDLEETKENSKDFNSDDSDVETDNQSSVNTIELNSSDITIHHAETNEEKQNRRTASTGDLTKIPKKSSGTLERAQSLDITDTGIPAITKKRKGERIEDSFDVKSDEDLFGNVMIRKEPRLSLILDGLNTFQRNRLKKSTEWGNLEDAILKLNHEENYTGDHSTRDNLSLEVNENLDFGKKSKEFDALVNKINEIKRESIEINDQVRKEKKVKNQIWPNFLDDSHQSKSESKPEMDATTTKEILIDRKIIPESKIVEPNSVLSDLEKLEPIKPYQNQISFGETIPKLTQVDKRQRKPAMQVPSEEAVPILDIPETIDLTEEVMIDKSEVEVAEKNKSDDEIKVCYDILDITNDFLFTEQLACSNQLIYGDYGYAIKAEDTNISDDIKVSRHSLGSLEQIKIGESELKTSKHNLGSLEQAKLEEPPVYSQYNNNVSNVTISKDYSENGDNSLHSLELNLDEPNFRIDTSKISDLSELYTTAFDRTLKLNEDNDRSTVTISTPDIIKNVAITEAMNSLNDVTIQGPSSLTLEIPTEVVGVTENKFSTLTESLSDDFRDVDTKKIGDLEKNSPLTYITEIQVITPNNPSNVNISEIEIVPNEKKNKNLDNEFEKYVKRFDYTDIPPSNLDEKIDLEIEPPTLEERINAEKELHKIQEIAEEQLKKLPEMRFSTSSYEGSKIPEKRQSQIEVLRLNFEKSPPKMQYTSKIDSSPTTKSRIPIATSTKTPPTSPERRDSKNLDMENDKAILELMSSSVHSTPMVSKLIKPSNKNVTVTSIRSNSKIPSGLPVLSGSGRPPIPPRKHDSDTDNVVQLNTNGGMESSFKQWVFNPDNTVTNIVVTENKHSLHKQ